MRAEADRLGLASAVEFVGQADRAQVDTEFEGAWALVAPSLWAEPFGIIALEALARGVPVVATEGGGFDETVSEPSTGILVPAGDESALADALLAVATRRAFPNHEPDARAATEVIQRHDLGDHVDSLRALLRLTIGARASEGRPSARRRRLGRLREAADLHSSADGYAVLGGGPAGLTAAYVLGAAGAARARVRGRRRSSAASRRRSSSTATASTSAATGSSRSSRRSSASGRRCSARSS